MFSGSLSSDRKASSLLWRWKGKTTLNAGASQEDNVRTGRIVQYRDDFYVIRYDNNIVYFDKLWFFYRNVFRLKYNKWLMLSAADVTTIGVCMHVERLYPTFLGSNEYRLANHFFQDSNPMASCIPDCRDDVSTARQRKKHGSRFCR